MRIQRRQPDSSVDYWNDVHPLVARAYAARGVTSSEQLDYSLAKLASYDSLLDIDKAVDLLEVALTRGQRILIVGDFDADGATSCAVAVLGLKRFGAKQVDYLIPNRFEFGYGLTPEIVAVASQYAPDLLITVDNGISSHAGVRAARDLGIKVLITDHHLPGPELPVADAIVNPNQGGCEFPSKAIAGVGVMFYVLLALRARLRQGGWFEDGSRLAPNLAELLDLVALGTVADVVPLDRNNRTLVSQGLARIRAGRCRPGITAILEVAGRDQSRVVTSDMGFALAPRLNAAGRLTDMARGVECLLCDEPARALAMAHELDQLNKERRSIESSMHDQALVHLSQLPAGEESRVGVCLFDSSWHQGVVGIVASRIKEKLHRPVIAFALEDEDNLKGSGRSIPGFHIRDALQEVERNAPELMTRYGGHAMAAGLTLPRAHLQRFGEAFDAVARSHLSDAELSGVVTTDGELEPRELTLEAAQELRMAGPWGQGFPEPLYDGQFEVVDSRILKDKHIKMSVRIPGSSTVLEAINFNADVAAWREVPKRPAMKQVRLVYRLDVNDYRGVRSVNLIVQRLESIGG